MDRIPITRENYDKLREELRRLEEEELPKVREQLAAARAEGDLRENAEYHGQRERQGMLMAQINELRAKLSNCQIIDSTESLPNDVVTFRSIVTVRDLDSGAEEVYQLVGPGEEDYGGEVMKILTNSPFAQGLLNKKVGDQVEIEVPAGTVRLEIVKIEAES
ncbi:MAG: transcription elongation factor GreA [Planctomycetota bacterium]|nr:MAG: transcription elongation factor GreA [Planctomycetota bacterium]